jgi:2-dehydro-3-deoxygluconokinase
MKRIVCVGECMVELRPAADARFERGFAGDTYNTAVYLKRSLPGACVQFLSATGDDPLSGAMRESWARQGVDGSTAYTVPGATPGLYLIETDADGERRFHYWRGESAARQWWSLLAMRGGVPLEGADLIYLSGISLAILRPHERAEALQLLCQLRARGSMLAFDPNVRPRLWSDPSAARELLLAALAACDIALPSTEDLRWLLGVEQPARQIDILRKLGLREVALTLGAEGALLALGDERIDLAAVRVEQVVDTSGAGDAFNGAYLAARLAGQPATFAAAAALELAARVVGHAGAIVPASVSRAEEQ